MGGKEEQVCEIKQNAFNSIARVNKHPKSLEFYNPFL